MININANRSRFTIQITISWLVLLSLDMLTYFQVHHSRVRERKARIETQLKGILGSITSCVNVTMHFLGSIGPMQIGHSHQSQFGQLSEASHVVTSNKVLTFDSTTAWRRRGCEGSKPITIRLSRAQCWSSVPQTSERNFDK